MADDALPAGWRRVRPADVPGVAWTLALDGVPGGPPWRRALLAAWCVPARALSLAGRGLRHRDDRRVAARVTRPPGRWTVVVVLLGLGVAFRVLLDVLPDATSWRVVLGVGAAYGYLASVVMLSWLRDRAERSPAERRGLFRVPGGEERPTWRLGRVATRDGVDRAAALDRVRELIDAVAAPGDTVAAAARSDRQQAELERVGFTELRGAKGTVVLRVPAAPDAASTVPNPGQQTRRT